ncbi:MAG TPA: gluconate 2-dehydrogenase subunit 3 family protein [Opitutaceae bacterium]|jgi:hypothetical protein
MDAFDTPRMDRRSAIKWIMAAGAGAALLSRGRLLGAAAQARTAKGYGTDPDVMKASKPGDYWPLTLTPAERRAAAALCDIVLPAEGAVPGALGVGVPDFLDEWVSAPYPEQASDRTLVSGGLAWVDAESRRRFGSAYADASAEQRATLAAAMSPEAADGSEMAAPSAFFRRFRDLTAIGYYTTPDGMKDLGYVGNVPLATFDGPPADVVERLGLTDEVKW